MKTFLFSSRISQIGVALILASVMFFTGATLASAQTSSISDLRARIVALQEQVALLQQLLAVQQQLAALTESGGMGTSGLVSTLESQITQGSEGLQELFGSYQELTQRYNRYADIFPQVDAGTQSELIGFIEEIEEIIASALSSEQQGDMVEAEEQQQVVQGLLEEADAVMTLFEERMLPQSEVTRVLENRLQAISNIIERNREQLAFINIESLEEQYAEAEVELRQVFVSEQLGSAELEEQILSAETLINELEVFMRSTIMQYYDVDLQGLSGGLQRAIRKYIDVELDFLQKVETLENEEFVSINELLDEARIQIDLAIATEVQGSQTMATSHVQTAQSLLEDVEQMLMPVEVVEEEGDENDSDEDTSEDS